MKITILVKLAEKFALSSRVSQTPYVPTVYANGRIIRPFQYYRNYQLPWIIAIFPYLSIWVLRLKTAIPIRLTKISYYN